MDQQNHFWKILEMMSQSGAQRQDSADCVNVFALGKALAEFEQTPDDGDRQRRFFMTVRPFLDTRAQMIIDLMLKLMEAADIYNALLSDCDLGYELI
jgi:hypothetical protein